MERSGPRLKVGTVGVMFLCGFVAGCAVKAPLPGIGIANQSSLPVTLVVNGSPVMTLMPGFQTAAIDPGTLPALPWHIEVQIGDGSDHILADVTADNMGASVSSWSSTCGVVTIWWARGAPSLLPVYTPQPSSNCH